MIEYGEIKGSKAKKPRTTNKCNLLKTKDIDGAQSGTAWRTGCKPLFNDTKYPVRSDDIDGASPNTTNRILKFVNNRPTDPENQ